MGETDRTEAIEALAEASENAPNPTGDSIEYATGLLEQLEARGYTVVKKEG